MAQSNDPDVDAVIGSFDHPEAAHDSDAATVLAGYDTAPVASPRVPPTASQHAADVFSIYKKHPFTTGIGLAENALSGVTGGVGSLADAVTGSDPGTHDWAYSPRTEAGRELADASADESSALGRRYDAVAGTGPLAQTIKERVPEALGAVGTVTGFGEIPRIRAGLRAPPIDAQAALDSAAANSPQSMGAAASAPRLHSLSPELQQGVRNAVQQTGGAVPAETLARHVEADSLPVKVQLTEGQATQDPQTISQEMNNRGRTPEMISRLNQQNQQLIDNVRELRDRVGPDVFTTNPVDHGASLIEAYKSKDEPIKADITAKYKALEDANGGQFPLDTNGFVKSTDTALSKALKSNSIPSDLAATLNEFRNGRQMTFEDFESLRSDAADAARTASDGRQRAAAGIIRDQLENMPLTPEAAKLKPLADAARSAARARFQALDADPAYEAAVHGSVPEDRFVQRFITGPIATRNGVSTMRENLADNPIATQTMGVATLDHLRTSAGIDPMGNGNFTQAGFNKALTALDPKLQSLVDPKTAEHLGTLGNVARYTQVQPRGSYVNNSNTLVGALAEHGKSLAEGAANKVLGLGVVPVGSLVREAAQKRAAAQATAKSLAPGAGLTRLPDAPKK
jgi:hypothetical protein